MNDKFPFTPHPEKVSETGCVTLIGMAAAGKTTIARELSALIGWPQIDVDNVIEAFCGSSLNNISNALSKEAFLDLEAEVIRGLNVRRVILSTGGSAVYRNQAVSRLRELGPVIHIAVALDVILERIARKPDRGLAIAPGQSVEDLFRERERLYAAAADHTVPGGREDAARYAENIARWLAEKP